MVDKKKAAIAGGLCLAGLITAYAVHRAIAKPPIPSGYGRVECKAYTDTVEVSATVEISGVGTYRTPFTVDLKPGTYTFKATYDTQTETQTVVVVEGEVKTVTFTFALPPISPPVGIPVAIRSLGAITVKSNVGAWITGSPCVDQHIHVGYFGNSWEPNTISYATIYFQVIDAAGRGVPDVPVAMWTDKPPDPSKYKGIIQLDGEIHTFNNPLVKKTDDAGIVWANVSYLYGLDDKFKTLCDDAGLRFQIVYCPLPMPSWPLVPHDCLGLGALVAVINKWGEKETLPQLNRVYAQVPGTTLYTFEYATCLFYVRWL